MWNALRSDLTEFVNTVTGDTAEALNQIDASFPDNTTRRDTNNNDDDDDDEPPTAAEQEALRRMALEETFTTPLIPEKLEKGNKEEENNAEGEEEKDDDDDDDAKEQAENTNDEYEEDEEVSEDVKEFVASFSIDTKTDEIALLLDLHPDTLKAQFEKLVPTSVKYEQFWMRYFYRCDAERIQAEWDAEEAAARQARADAVKQGLSTVRNLLGGAVKAVSSTLKDEGNGTSPGGGLRLTTNQAAKVASGYFGSAGRPPFVMNTAVSEDDFDGEEDEEELGWDDEDEEFDEENEDEVNEESVDTEQIEFNDAVTEKLQEELKQALAERDSLQQTVELQQKELASLKKGETPNSEIEKLKTQLFEKESEMAAMRASMLDSSRTEESQGTDPKMAALEEEVQQLNNNLEKAESSASEAMSKLQKVQNDLEQKNDEIESLKSALTLAETKNKDLENSVAELTGKMANLKADNQRLQDALKAVELKAEKAQSSQSETAALQAQLDQLKNELATSQAERQKLDAELEKAKEALRIKEEISKAEDEAKSVDSPDTVSTGIKIEPPAIEKLDEEAAVEDGWDDWGDEDED